MNELLCSVGVYRGILHVWIRFPIATIQIQN